jgi:hypothetical protein
MFYHTSIAYYICLWERLCSCFGSLAWVKKNPANFNSEMASTVDVESCEPYSCVCVIYALSLPSVHERKLTLYTSVRRMIALCICLVTNLSHLKPTAGCHCNYSLFRRRDQSYSRGAVILLLYQIYRILCVVWAIHLGHDDLHVHHFLALICNHFRVILPVAQCLITTSCPYLWLDLWIILRTREQHCILHFYYNRHKCLGIWSCTLCWALAIYSVS